MSEAPARIWAFMPDIFDNISIWQDQPSPALDGTEYSIWQDQPSPALDTTEYIRADLARPKVKPLEWVEGTYITTDDDNGPMEGRQIGLWAWRTDIYTIIRQRGPDGLYVLRNKSDGIGVVVSTLEDAKAVAQDDYERRILSALATQEAPDEG